jgi:hypothetical protein
MAKGTCVCFISLFLLMGSRAVSQDTVTIPLHFRAGFDISGPILHLLNDDLISYGVLGSLDLNQAISLNAGLRYTTFSAVEYNYNFSSRGTSIVIGADYNFMKPKTAQGRYQAGIGLRYGLSFYSQEASDIKYTNKWGEGVSSMPLSRHTGHYLEITPGVRTELFNGVTIGWNVYMRLLISAGAGKDLKPIWMPGYGDATSRMATGAEYYVSFSIPYKKIKVIIKPKPVEEDAENAEGAEGTEGTETTTTIPRSTTGGRR